MEEVLTISDHIWQDVVNVIFTDDINARIKEQAELNNFSPEPYLIDRRAGAVFCNIVEENYHGSWILFDYKTCNLGVIVHEVNHLVHRMLKTRDITLNEKTKEVFAYTEQWFFDKISNFYLTLIANAKEV